MCGMGGGLKPLETRWQWMFRFVFYSVFKIIPSDWLLMTLWVIDVAAPFLDMYLIEFSLVVQEMRKKMEVFNIKKRPELQAEK